MHPANEEWSASEWLTLRLGPVWVLSALVGRIRFDAVEQEAFWRIVDEVGRRHPGLASRLMDAAFDNRDWLFDEFELDGRPVVSGLSQVVSLLERTSAEASAEAREAILEVGHGFARARGPFGRRESQADTQVLLLVAQLLETTTETARNNPLNSHLPI
ncbi:MAG TPA: hypothetical protein VFP89_03240 [Propionibacteriaceae bacterium]|nr:hypothetical protein [Propionibacteriaceae bacterium]